VKAPNIGHIEILEWTEADHLRHAKFVRLRDDKDLRKVVKEIENNSALGFKPHGQNLLSWSLSSDIAFVSTFDGGGFCSGFSSFTGPQSQGSLFLRRLRDR
jgi:hypothetical protein